MHEILELHTYTRDQIGELLKYAAKLAIVGGEIYVGQFGEQRVRWGRDGSATVTTAHTLAELSCR